MNDTHTMAELIADYAAEFDIRSAELCVRGLAERLVEDFCPDIEITDEETKQLQRCYENLLKNYLDQADQLIKECADNCRETYETRMEGLRAC